MYFFVFLLIYRKTKKSNSHWCRWAAASAASGSGRSRRPPAAPPRARSTTPPGSTPADDSPPILSHHPGRQKIYVNIYIFNNLNMSLAKYFCRNIFINKKNYVNKLNTPKTYRSRIIRVPRQQPAILSGRQQQIIVVSTPRQR